MAAGALITKGVADYVAKENKYKREREILRIQRDVSLSNVERQRRLQALAVSPFLTGGSSFFADNDREAATKSAYINREASLRIKQYRLGFNDFFGTVLGGVIGFAGKTITDELSYQFGEKLHDSLEKSSAAKNIAKRTAESSVSSFYSGADRMLNSGTKYQGYYNPLNNDTLKGVMDIQGY